MSRDRGENQLERRSYTCNECDIIITIRSSTSPSPYCLPFGLDDHQNEDNEELIPTVVISSSTLCCSSSDDSTLPCTECREDFVLVNLLGDCLVAIYTIMIALFLSSLLPVAASGDDIGLAMWFDVLALEDDLEEDMGTVPLNLYQSLDG
ncbi:hypothetical protein Bca52824_003319 [Brassica carinata]|uniref:Uncharacterized protein n=1 Tax=Brassica carinata TaxID=52824 RepID=A0A8X8BBC2_BRACI|nr:hypothetical protein Bca52824_003319 [Brassica carinata]